MANDVPPTAAQRWIAGHRAGMTRTIVVAFIVLAGVNVWGLIVAPSWSPILGLGIDLLVACFWFMTLGSITKSVKRWDADHPTSPGPG